MTPSPLTHILAWRLVEQLPSRPDAWNHALAERVAQDPAACEALRIGFIPALGRDYYEALDDGHGLFAINKAKRVLPGKVVRQAVDHRVRVIEREEERRVFAREKTRLKEQVFEELLPAAFVEHKQVYALHKPPYLFIGTGSAKEAEELLDEVRRAFGSLKVVPVSIKETPIRYYTRWLIDEHRLTHPRFRLGEKFALHGGGSEPEVVKGQWHFASDETLSDWLARGNARATMVGLVWRSPSLEADVGFTVNEMLGMKGIKWPAALHDQARDSLSDDEDQDSEYQRSRATMLIMAHEMDQLWQDLLEALGGEAQPRTHDNPRDDAETADDLI